MQSPDQAGSSPHPGEPVDILLVEDNLADAEIFLAILRRRDQHLNVYHVKDGVEALEYLSETAIPRNGRIEVFPKLILLDLKMPRLNGIQFLEHIKKHSLLKVIPIIVFTSSSQQIDIQRCYQLGANCYLVKPVDFRVYNDFVGEFCDFWLKKNHLPEILSEQSEGVAQQRKSQGVH